MLSTLLKTLSIHRARFPASLRPIGTCNKNGKRWVHAGDGKNYAPDVVKVHIDMVRRHDGDVLPIYFSKNKHIPEKASLQQTLVGLERSIGVKPDDAYKMLQFSPTLSAYRNWIKRLQSGIGMHYDEKASLRPALDSLARAIGIGTDDASKMLKYAPYHKKFQKWLDPLGTWSDIHHGSKHVPEKAILQPALDNLERVIGIEADDAYELLKYSRKEELPQWIERLETWKDIHRGKDLFLPGLGNFDVKTCYEQIVWSQREKFLSNALPMRLKTAKKRMRRELGIELNGRSEDEALRSCIQVGPLSILELPRRKGSSWPDEFDLWLSSFNGRICVDHDSSYDGSKYATPFWLITANELRARAYFPNVSRENLGFIVRILALPDHNLKRKHILQYRDYWDSNMQGFIQLAEVIDEIDWERLANEGDGLPSPEKVKDALELAKLDDGHFKVLEEIPDHGRVRLLRSTRQIVDSGRKLHNCLRYYHSGHEYNFEEGDPVDSWSYSKRVEKGDILLVCLDDENGKPTAVGMYKRPRWISLEGASNKNISTEARSAFDEYIGKIPSDSLHTFDDDILDGEILDDEIF